MIRRLINPRPLRWLACGAPWLAVVFITLCLASIPYGLPVSKGYGTGMVASCLVMLVAARFTPTHWNRLTLWPILLLLGVYAIGCLASVDRDRSIARFVTMPLLAMVFVAVQVASAEVRAFRVLLLVGVAAMLAIVADVCFARFTGRTLFHEGTASTVRTAASQGNPNDLAAASLLLPLAWAVVPRRGAVLCFSLVAAMASLVWVLSAGRQVAIGWVVATLVPLAMHLGLKRSAWVVLGLAALAAVSFGLDPFLRTRLGETLESGLGDRKPLIAFGLWQWWQRPWIGNGPGTFGELYLRAATADWSWNGLTLQRVGMPWAHNLIVEVLSDLGLVGIAAFGVVIVAAARRVRSALAGDTNRRRLAIAAAALGLTVAAIGMVDLTLIKDWFRCVTFLGLGLAFVPQGAKSIDPAQETRGTPRPR